MRKLPLRGLRKESELLSNQESTVRNLGMGIIRGSFPQGQLLPSEAELMARYGISRTMLREIIKTLSAKGLVQARTRIGTIVQDRGRWNMFDSDVLAWHLQVGVNESFLRDLAEIRIALEPDAAALAATRRSEGDLAAMWQAHRRMAEPSISAENFAEADLAFHMAILTASGNAIMRSVGAIVQTALITAFNLSSPAGNSERLSESVSSHGRILTAIEAGDAKGAHAMMEHVIRVGFERMAQSLQNHARAG